MAGYPFVNFRALKGNYHIAQDLEKIEKYGATQQEKKTERRRSASGFLIEINIK
jgi:hypothetical protein